MSVIEASSVRLQTMADGTLRITVDIEPRHAQDAFKLFGAPGTPMALAALKTAFSEPEKPEQGLSKPIAKWLALRCKERQFWRWLDVTTEEEAAARVRYLCEVESRGDIDGNKAAEDRFRRLIQGPWSKHCIATGVVT